MGKNRIVFALVALLVATLLPAAATAAPSGRGRPRVQTSTVVITDEGYSPDAVRFSRGVPARLIFLRKSEGT